MINTYKRIVANMLTRNLLDYLHMTKLAFELFPTQGLLDHRITVYNLACKLQGLPGLKA